MSTLIPNTKQAFVYANLRKNTLRLSTIKEYERTQRKAPLSPDVRDGFPPIFLNQMQSTKKKELLRDCVVNFREEVGGVQICMQFTTF